MVTLNLNDWYWAQYVYNPGFYSNLASKLVLRDNYEQIWQSNDLGPPSVFHWKETGPSW